MRVWHLHFTYLWLSTGVFKNLTQEYILGVLIIIINFNNMFNIKNKERGFTLIELLIVIAIIGVLAATVVVSLGSQTDKAQEGSIKLGISSIRNVATVAVTEGGVPNPDYDAAAVSGSTSVEKLPLKTPGVCPLIYEQVSGEKGGWSWGSKGADKKVKCKADDSDAIGEVCCASSGKKWVLWAKLTTGDRTSAPTAKVYCADSVGFAGEVQLKTTVANSTKVEDGDPAVATGPTSCN